jgi:hypothetical protein
VFTKGSAGEWVMFGVYLAASLVVLLALWRGRMKERIDFKTDWPLFMVLIGFHVSDIIFALSGGHFEILMVQAIATAVQAALVFAIYARGRKLSRIQTAGHP